MKAIWQGLEKWLSKNAAHLSDDLLDGATDAELDAIETAIGKKLPADFRAFYQIHNGQAADSERLIDGEELLSSGQIIEERVALKAKKTNCLPFTTDGAGNYYALNLLEKNTPVVRIWEEGTEVDVVAKSFTEWMTNYVKDLEKGVYIYSEEWGGIINKEDTEDDGFL